MLYLAVIELGEVRRSIVGVRGVGLPVGDNQLPLRAGIGVGLIRVRRSVSARGKSQQHGESQKQGEEFLCFHVFSSR